MGTFIDRLLPRTSNFGLIFFVCFVAACGGGGSGDNNGMNGQTTTTLTTSVNLSATQVFPPVVSDASGGGSLVLDLDTGELSGSVSLLNLDPTVAHIHRGFAGENGQIAVLLEQDGGNNLIWRVPPNTLLSASDIQLYRNTGLYINVHTLKAPGGEVRGQILASQFRLVMADLTGEQVVPPVTTMASARAAVTIDTTNHSIDVRLLSSNLSDATAAHIHLQSVGENGDLVVALTQDASDLNLWSVVDEALTDAVYDALFADGLYLDIHTTTNPDGELRAQLVP